MTSYRWPRPSVSPAELSAPEKMSSTPVAPSDISNAVARTETGETEGLLDMPGVALPGSRSPRLLGGIVEHPPHLLGGKARRAGGGRSRSEGDGNLLGASMIEHPRVPPAERQHYSRSDVEAKRHRAHQPRPVDAELFSSAQGRRDSSGARIGARRRMDAVGFVGVSEHAIHQCRFNRSACLVGSDDCGPLLSGVRAGEAQRDLPRWQVDPGHHRRQGVENVKPGGLQHVGRQIAAGAAAARQLTASAEMIGYDCISPCSGSFVSVQTLDQR